MNEIQKIQETVTKLFINTDNQNWAQVEMQFTPKVNLDYSSMTGSPATNVPSSNITTSWKTILPGFTFTQHQIGNFITKIKDNKAHTFCYGTATHYIESENSNVWSVVGSYDFDLEKIGGNWKITSMVFNYKYQDGNESLVQKALENAKSK